MEIRIIKTDEQYRKALEEVGRLAEKDPVPESTDGARLELLAKLVEDYEKDRFLFKKPDPIDAIVFRMEEKGLRTRKTLPTYWAAATAHPRFFPESALSRCQ